MSDLSNELKQWLADRAAAIEALEGVLAEELMKRDARIAKLETGFRQIIDFSDSAMQDGDAARDVARALMAPPPTPDSLEAP